MRRTLFAPLAALALTLAGLTLTVSGSFADLPSSVTSLRGAIDARIAAIGKPATKPLKAELASLKSAAKALAKYTGTLSVPDLNQLRLAGSGIGKSRTEDSAVVQGGIALVSDLLSELEAQEKNLFALGDQFVALKDRDQLQTLIDAARADAASAAAIADTDIPRALTFAKAAGVKYAKALRFAEGVVAAEESSALPIMSYPFNVQNRNGKKFKVTAVSMDVLYFPPGTFTGQRITVDLKDYQDPGAGLTLPYTLIDNTSEFPMYPLMYAALVANVTGGAPENGTIRGSLRFSSSKHGTVNIPVEDFVVETP